LGDKLADRLALSRKEKVVSGTPAGEPLKKNHLSKIQM
jgi:hypothetical protein